VVWFRLDDKAHSHAKVIEVGNRAYGAWVRMGCWSSDHLTDGRIPVAVAIMFSEDNDDIRALLRVGLLDEIDDDSYQVHDFVDYNPTAKQVKRQQKQRVDAGRIGGKRKASNSLANAKRNASETPSKTQAKPCPVPVPVPVPVPGSTLSSASPTREADASLAAAIAEVFEFWKDETGHAKARLTADRKRRIKARIKEGFSSRDLCSAIRGRRGNPHLMGQNDTSTVYDKIATLLRDGEQVESLMALDNGGSAASTPQVQRAMRLLAEEQAEHDAGRSGKDDGHA